MEGLPGGDHDKPSDVLYKDIVRTLYNMQESDVCNDQEKHYKRTLWGLQLTMKGLADETRKRVEADIRLCEDRIKEIKDKTDNASTAKVQLVELYESFAKAHRFFVIEALSKIGILKNYEDGEIDFGKMDVEQMGKAIRSGHGLEKSVDGSMGERK